MLGIDTIIWVVLISGLITKGITTHREEMEYAKQGITSPRQRRKVMAAKQKAKQTGQPYQAPPAPGAKGFFRDLWADLWEDLGERRQQARQEYKTGKRDRKSLIGELLDWRLKPLGDQPQQQQPAAGSTSSPAGGSGKAGAVPSNPATQPHDPNDPPAGYCPDCGGGLWPNTKGGYDHATSRICGVTGAPWTPRNRPAPPPPNQSQPAPAPAASGPSAPAPAPAAVPTPRPQPAPTPAPAAAGQTPGPSPTPPPAAAKQCLACGEVLTAVGQAGHVCPRDPQNREPELGPVDSATFAVPTEEDVERMREASGLCAVCRAAPVELWGKCRRCYDRHWEVQENREMYGNTNPACPRCGDYLTKYATADGGRSYQWMCADCWVSFNGPEPEWHKQQREKNAAEDGTKTSEPDPDKGVYQLEVLPDGSTNWVHPDGTREPVKPFPTDPCDTDQTDKNDRNNQSTPATPATHTAHTGGQTVALEFNYDRIVAEHDAAIESLRAQLDRAQAVSSKMTEALALVDGMDSDRQQTVDNCTALVEGMTEARFDAASAQGATEAAESFNAGKVATVQEHMEETKAEADREVQRLEVALGGVEASKAHIVAQYGDIAAGVQATGVRGEAMEAA